MRGQWVTSAAGGTEAGAEGRASRSCPTGTNRRRVGIFLVNLALVAWMLGVLPAPAVLPPAQAATTNTLTLAVTSARTEPRAFGGSGVAKGDPVDKYKFIINVDNTGTTAQRSPSGGCASTDAGYPGSCHWPSIQEVPHASPIYTQGNQDDLAGGVTLPDGRYLISVIADGYKIDGEHFTVPLTGPDPNPGLVTVELQPNPLPDSTLRAQVFADGTPTNGAIDQGEDGLPGFQGHINDTLGEVSTDVYGNPLCTTYVGENHDTHVIPVGALDADMLPVVDQVGGKCLSDSTGMLTIPHLGTNRYALSVTPPDGQQWIQTTTLEGNHDWDTWLMEGSTGYDTEFTVAGEPVPQPMFGFASPGNDLAAGSSGHIQGTVVAIRQYTPPKGGSFNFWLGMTGSEVAGPIAKPWLSLADLNSGDRAVWVGQGNADGSFDISGVPDGDYMLTWWDEPQDYFVNMINVTVRGGETVHMGQLPLNGWWTQYDGYVFNDANRNGVKDPGESGIPNFTLTLRHEENSLMDRGQNTATTDSTGHYYFETAYPLGEWTVMEAYNDSFFTTGVTYQADNQPTPTTVKGAGVDVSVLSVIGLSGRLDWGVHAYDPTGRNGIDPRNGGIVGSISYDTTRNELDPQYAAAEDWQPGVSDVPVELYAPVDCPTDGSAPCDANGDYQLAPDGSYATGKLLNTYVSEHWSRPTGCVARDVDGNPLVHGVDENVLVPNQGTDGECISSFLQSVQFGPYPTGQGTPDANFGAAVDGNYGFGDGCFNGTLDATDPANPDCVGGSFDPLGAGDYLVRIDIPDDASGKPMYQVTREEDINIGNGDQIVPQVPPPACAGALHTVDVGGGAPVAATLKTGAVADNNALTWTAEAAGPAGNDVSVALVAAGNDTPLSVEVTGSDIVVHLATDATGAAASTAAQVAAAVQADPAASSLVTVTATGASDGTGVVAATAPAHLAGGAVQDGYAEVVGDGGVTNDVPVGVTVPASTPVDNATFADSGGSPYEGRPEPLCDTKLVRVNNGKSVVPMFNVFTDVPLPSRLRGLIVDDINYSTDPRSIVYGEKAGVPFAPVGIYDFSNRLVHTVESDFNGYYDVLLPSTNHISCPTPSGVCANMYRFVGNDPGAPGHLNPNFNPRFRTIATEFEAIPGVIIPTDLAPTQIGVTIAAPQTGITQGVTCPLGSATPQLFAVSKPYVDATTRDVTIEGTGFGANQGTGRVTLDGTDLTVSSWGATTIHVTVPNGTPVGPHQLEITAGNGMRTVNGLTVHVLGAGYNPALREVGPGHTYAKVQAAVDAAFDNNGDDLVVVYPGAANTSNPRGAYYENLVVASPVKLQGVGPGGFQGNTYVPGSILDASGFGGDTQLATDWFTKVGGLTWDGNQAVNDGEGIYLLASENATTAAGRARQFTSDFKAAIDGFDLRGGTQEGFPGNINDLTGAPTGLPPNIVTQGGAIFANAFVRHLQVTNNVVEHNGGGYGTIRIGTPDLAAPDTDQHNENVRIADNRIISNAGTNLAGAVGLYAGADGYEVSGNDICGNFSLEYGGGLTVYGRSPNGKIHHNRIYFNYSNDEGGGVMIAGQLQPDPATLSPGSGPVDIFANQIQANMANDDGGGIRFLMAGGPGGTDQMNVFNNMVVNNVSTHEGGGISLNDAPTVRVFNNTIMKNLTTATAVTSNGQPAPAGLSTSPNSEQLQATLPSGAPGFSDPVLFNNIFWDNRAGTRAGTTVTGIGLAGDSTAVNHWDLGMFDAPGLLAPTSSVVQQDSTEHAYTTSTTNSTSAPAVVETYDVSVSFATWRQNPAFVDATLVTLEAPPNLLGDYHLSGCPASPACNLGAANRGGVSAPATDFDDQARPAGGGIDAGADEFGASVVTPPAASDLYFSTTGSTNPPGVSGTADDADIYKWDGTAYSRAVDVSAAPYNVPSSANIDGFSRVDATHFYASFTGPVTLPGAGAVDDEDVVYYDGATWSLWFDGSAKGVGATDLDAVSVVGNTLYFSTDNTTIPPGAGGTGDDADIYRWDGGGAFTRVIDASALGWSTANVDGLSFVDSDHLYLSYSVDTTVPGGLGTVQDEDIVYRNSGAWSVFFDGTAHGLTQDSLDLDAISFAGGAQPPPPPPALSLVFSTQGNTNPPGVGGTADDADLYGWNTSSFSRVFDASGAGVPGGANVDGFDRVSATQFYLSFTDNVTIARPGPDLTVQDEDVVYYDAGTWSVFFDGTAHGLGTSGNLDLDAISVAGSTVYFSTLGNTNPPGVTGTADDADIYSWDGTSYARVWDASANGVAGAANVDGYARVDAGHFYLSFASDTTLTGPGATQDEDVVFNNSGAWSVYFDGTAHGLGASGSLNVDAFDVP